MDPTDATPARAPAQPADRAALAREVGRRMWAEDPTPRSLGIELLEIGPGYARMRMTVRGDMTNGHGLCHGGYTFLLADCAFAYACNSHGQRAVAASAEIHFLAPAHAGDVLTAEGVEQHLGGRSGVYDMRVTDQHGRVIALFRGKSATIRGRIEETAAPAAAPAPTVSKDGRR